MSQRELGLDSGETTSTKKTDDKPAAQVYLWRRRQDLEHGPGSERPRPGSELAQEIERLNRMRLQHIHLLTGALSSCVVFRRGERVEPLFWLDTEEGERDALVDSMRAGGLPSGWEAVSERDGDLEVVLCLKGAARDGMRAMKAYLIHWFAAQKFPCR